MEKLTAARCRENAEGCRAMARAEADQSRRKILEDLAAMWEQIREELEAKPGEGA
jgi:hypothetical protein